MNAHNATRIPKLGPPGSPAQLPVSQTSADTNFRRHQLPGANFWRDLPNHTDCNNATINIRIVNRRSSEYQSDRKHRHERHAPDDPNCRRHRHPATPASWCATINIINRAKIVRTASADIQPPPGSGCSVHLTHTMTAVTDAIIRDLITGLRVGLPMLRTYGIRSPTSAFVQSY